MAIDESMINQFDDQLQSADYNNNLRNCPTPLLGELSNDFLESHLGTFDSIDELISTYPSWVDGNVSPSALATGSYIQTAMSSQGIASISSNDQQPTNYVQLQPSSSSSYINSPIDAFLNETNTFKTIEHTSLQQSGKTPTLDNPMAPKSSRKEKCMSRNAVLARANREKKKHEQSGLQKRTEQLEEDNALWKKKYHELKESNQKLQERNNYLEAIIQNIPQILNMVEHMNKFPGN